MSTPTRTTASGDGLADRVTAVRTAREQLGRDLDQLDAEVRAQMSQTAERAAWKLLGTGLAIITGLVVRKILIAVWRRATRHEPPTNPAAADTTWGEAVAWALASGAAIGVGRLVGTRGATAGWQRVVGAPPPGMSDIGR
jgi:Protein of unknown function (DUF4235)